MLDLFHRSVEIILANQAPSGAFVASPNFPTYHFSWFRDGAFIAYAMDLAGEYASAARFHAWAADSINARTDVVARALEKTRQGESLTEGDILHTRYTLEGQDSLQEAWPNFQLDGFGTWLWSLGEHQRVTGTLLSESWQSAAGWVANYLKALWRLPCYDCWEEFPDQIHTSTLAAIYGGLQAHIRFTAADHSQALNEIKRFLHEQASLDGRFIKAKGRQDIDASMVSLATPYRVVSPQDEAMRKTVAEIEHHLLRGGVHRYPSDTYYGGGEWVLLAAWLGWYYSETGELDQAKALMEWVERQADENGCLPEQVPASLNDPPSYEVWVRRWGPVANPLLWSHAMYLILHRALEGRP